MKNKLIKLFKENKYKKTRSIPHLTTKKYQDGWGFLYDVYCDIGTIRVASTHILLFSNHSMLSVEKYPITLVEYEKLINDLPKRYKRLKKPKL